MTYQYDVYCAAINDTLPAAVNGCVSKEEP
jgi:hypothetical protein